MVPPQARCKWKEVLGFDDGGLSTASKGTKLGSPQIFQLFQSQIQPSYPKFPKDITLFRSRGDIVISPSIPAPSPSEGKPLPPPPPLFYLTLQNDPSSSTGRPDMILHSGPNKASTIASFAKFQPGHQGTEITLCPPPRKSISANFSTIDLPLSIPSSSTSSESSSSIWSREDIDRPRFRYERLIHSRGRFTSQKYSFCHTIPSTSVREKFEWRYTAGKISRSRGTDESAGMKLVRTSTNETVAVYAGLGRTSLENNPSRVVGMLRFLRGEGTGDLEEDWEILAVMSILSVVEKGRRIVRERGDRFEFD